MKSQDELDRIALKWAVWGAVACVLAVLFVMIAVIVAGTWLLQ